MAAQNAPANDAMLQTLNSALGNIGGRQKSWMSSNTDPMPAPSDVTMKPAPLTVHRRGRPPKNPATQSRPQQPTIEHARPSIEPLVERQPPSNSTSPQLANILTDRDKTRLQPPAVIVFPSPTPSEENTHTPQMIALRGGDGMANLDSMQLERGTAAFSPDTPSETISMDTVQQQRTGSRRRKPSEEAVTHVEKRRRPAEGRQEQTVTMASTTGQTSLTRPQASTFAHPSSAQQQHVPSPHLEQMHSRTPSVQSPQLARGLDASGAPPQARIPSGPRRTSSRGVPTVPLNVPADLNSTQYSSPAQAAQHYLQPAWYTNQDCLHVLEVFHRSQDVASVRPLDRSRLSVLKTAALAEDWSYTTMHQFYCLLDYDPSSVPAEVLNHPSLDKAMSLMSNVLESNKQLSRTVLHLCANFPYSLKDISAHWPVMFRQQVRKFLSFVSASQFYNQMKLTCETRRFPPLAWELTQYLMINSATFQRILFTAVLRALWQWVPAHEQRSQYEAKGVEFFKQNQAEFNRRFAITEHDPHQTSVDNQVDLQHWGPRMRSVVEEFELIANSPHLRQITQLQSSPQYRVNTPDMSSRTQRPFQHPPPQHVLQQSRGPGRLRTHPAQPPMQQQRKVVPLLPPPGVIQPQQRQANPTRFSLHQAHLRSPILKARSTESPLYQYVQGFIKPPKRLSNVDQSVEKWSFSVDADMMRGVPATLPGPLGDVDQRVVDTNSKTIRLRCVKWPTAAGRPDDHTWTTTDTSWIPHSYFSFNGATLTQRKKVHHGKDLPIDITHLVKEGENTLEMTVMAQSNDKGYLNYLVAIEFLGITSHEQVKRDCLLKNRIPADQILSDIKNKLRTSDDDDVAIVESNLTINLFDPFSASRICDIPVRSRACLHPDCFDLETYLQTRRRKGDATVPDLWRCPICNADARPGHLIVDGFLQQVKTRLDAQGLSSTRAIVVQQDGSWEPKAEVRDPNGVSDDSPAPSERRKSIPAQAEVIDLSD
jgi:hypothetical protein